MCFFFISSFFLLTYHLSSPYKHPPPTPEPPPHPFLARNVSWRGVSSLPLPTTPLRPCSLPSSVGLNPPSIGVFFKKITILFIDLGEGYTTLMTGMPTSIDIWIAAARNLSQTFCPYFFIFLSTKKAVNNKLSNIKTNLSNIKTNLSIRTVCFQVRAT